MREFESYRLLKDDPKAMTIQHPDGSSFLIAKDGMDEDHVNHILANLPGYSDGTGDVEGPAAGAITGMDPQAQEPQMPWDQMQSQPRMAGAPSNEMEQDMPNQIQNYMQQPDVPRGPQGEPAPQPQADPNKIPGVQYGDLSDPMSLYNAGYSNTMQGMTDQYKVAQKAGAEQAAAWQGYNDGVDRIKQQRQAQMDDQYNKRQVLTNEIANYKIDPNQYFNNMSTGNKILAAISMIAGGLAGGLNKTGKNPALEVINDAIKRDMESQKTELDKKRSLLNANLESSRSIDESASHSMMDQMAVANGMIQQALAKAATPAAKANLETALGQYQNQLGEAIMKNQVLYGSPQRGEQSASKGMENIGAKISLLPQSLQDPAKEEYERMSRLNQDKEMLSQTYGEIKKLRGLTGVAVAPWTKEALAANEAKLRTILLSYTKARNLPPEVEEKMINPMIPTWTTGAEGYTRLTNDAQDMANHFAGEFPVLNGTPGLRPSKGAVSNGGGDASAKEIMDRQRLQVPTKVASGRRK